MARVFNPGTRYLGWGNLKIIAGETDFFPIFSWPNIYTQLFYVTKKTNFFVTLCKTETKVELKCITWTHFLRDDKSRVFAECIKCKRTVCCSGGSTRAKLIHLKLQNIPTTTSVEETENPNGDQNTDPVS